MLRGAIILGTAVAGLALPLKSSAETGGYSVVGNVEVVRLCLRELDYVAALEVLGSDLVTWDDLDEQGPVRLLEINGEFDVDRRIFQIVAGQQAEAAMVQYRSDIWVCVTEGCAVDEFRALTRLYHPALLAACTSDYRGL